MLASLSVLTVPARHGEASAAYVLEAWACGVPVVVPRHGAAAELVEAHGGGILCGPNDPRSLADAIGGLLGDADAARAMGEAGRHVVRQRFTAEHMATAVVRVLEATV